MDMDKALFSDGIGRISVIGGIVRADLITLSPPETDSGGQPRPVLSGRLVMSIEAFLRSTEKMQEAVQAISRAQQQSSGAKVASQGQPPSPSQAQSDQKIERALTTDQSGQATSNTTHPFP